MNLPEYEDHKTSEWVLRDKKIIYGRGFGGKEMKSYVTTFECKRCFKEYTRFVDEDEFEYLEVDDNRWEWGWEK